MPDTTSDSGREDASARPWAFFLDFDGTLVDIAARPEAVVVEPGLPETLERLRDRLGGALAIVTGRSIGTIDGFLSPHRFDVAGLHGAERRIGERSFPCRPDEHPDLRAAVDALRRRFAWEPGILIEDKGCSVAVHWRLAPHLADMALSAVEETAANLGEAYRLQRGKAVAEVLQASATKGVAIRRFLEHEPYRGRRPVFVGDDLTDEHAFETVNACGGASLRVGPGPTCALYRVPSPAALRAHLARWATPAPMDLGRLPQSSESAPHGRPPVA